MAERLSGLGVGFVFIYTREAHPGESWPRHESLEQKIEHARRMVERWDIRRRMLVDDLDGPLHRAYGMLPNMCYMVDSGGVVIYKADWTDPHNIEVAADHLLHEVSGLRSGIPMAHFQVEWLPRRPNDNEAFFAALAENGPKAVREFIEGIEHTSGPAAGRQLRQRYLP